MQMFVSKAVIFLPAMLSFPSQRNFSFDRSSECGATHTQPTKWNWNTVLGKKENHSGKRRKLEQPTEACMQLSSMWTSFVLYFTVKSNFETHIDGNVLDVRSKSRLTRNLTVATTCPGSIMVYRAWAQINNKGATWEKVYPAFTPVNCTGVTRHWIWLSLITLSYRCKGIISSFTTVNARGRKEAERTDVQCATWQSIQYAPGSENPLSRQLVYTTMRYAVDLPHKSIQLQ